MLEFDEGKGQGANFVECYNGRAKSFNLSKLQSSTHYRFRLTARNELGRSRPSEPVGYSTQGSAPGQPYPPGLQEATKATLLLAWAKRVSDEGFVLQMDDRLSGHGFLTCYNGSGTSYQAAGLRRNTSYRFRLQAHNEEGKSPWSQEVQFVTLPDLPGPPLRPASKGRLSSTAFKARWDPPGDTGGAPVTNYIMELDDGANGWRTAYRGPDLEHLCDGLRPGTQYKVRVACVSDGGVSPYSEVCHVCTEPVCPGRCERPRLHGKPRASSLHLRWGWPESDGGAQVQEFEVDMTAMDNSTRSVYRGRDTECQVASLLPGRPYLFQVRAHNRAGPGPWSESLEVVSGAGCPGQPEEPRVDFSKTHDGVSIAIFSWKEPINNGAIVQVRDRHYIQAAIFQF